MHYSVTIGFGRDFGRSNRKFYGCEMSELGEYFGLSSFFPVIHRVNDGEKNSTDQNIHPTLTSRCHKMFALRNTFHSVYQLQGPAAAEHANERVAQWGAVKSFVDRGVATWAAWWILVVTSGWKLQGGGMLG